ncbi:MAG: hypothetical protein ACRDPM_17845 [Solirubrobacteraceae bacterium]
MTTETMQVSPAPAAGVMPVHGINHLELFVGNADRAASYDTRAWGFTS